MTKITMSDIKSIKIESKEDFIRTLDMSIQLADEISQCIDVIGSTLNAQALPKAA